MSLSFKIFHIILISITATIPCKSQRVTNLLSSFCKEQKIEKLTLSDSSKIIIGSNTTLKIYDSSTLGKCIFTDGQIGFDRPNNVKDTLFITFGNQIIKLLNASFDINHYDPSEIIFNLIKGKAVIVPFEAAPYTVVIGNLKCRVFGNQECRTFGNNGYTINGNKSAEHVPKVRELS